jgi:hypothetical protein
MLAKLQITGTPAFEALSTGQGQGPQIGEGSPLISDCLEFRRETTMASLPTVLKWIALTKWRHRNCRATARAA